MLYALLSGLCGHPFLATTVGFRAGAALLTAFTLALIGGKWFLSHAQRFSARAREYTPSSHEGKHNTPTMGGLFLLGALIGAVLLWARVLTAEVLIFLGCLVGFGAIGLWDDWCKITGNKGITESSKFKAQVLVGSAVVAAWYFFLKPPLVLVFPILSTFYPLYIGLLLLPWACFILVGASNAVNLTDGLDGLATKLLISNVTLFSLMSYLFLWSGSLFPDIISSFYTGELFVLGMSTVGACLGFLWYNLYPAKVFMGDVGSLALGSVLALMALMIRQEFLLAFTGLIFVLETISVFLQVAYYKRTGKKLFKMAPLHHHFELLGWHEVTITGRFSLITFLLCLIGFMLFFLAWISR